MQPKQTMEWKSSFLSERLLLYYFQGFAGLWLKDIMPASYLCTFYNFCAILAIPSNPGAGLCRNQHGMIASPTAHKPVPDLTEAI